MGGLYSYMSDIGEFIRIISKVSSPAEFEALLERYAPSREGA